MFREIHIPENIEGLNRVRINEILYQRLSLKVRINDQRLRGINSYITRSLGPIVFILDWILQLKGSLMSAKNIERCTDGLKVDDRVFDVKNLRILLDKGTHLLAICNSVCLQKRKSHLKGSLDSKYHYLTRPSNKVTEDLLGPNLEQKITDSNRISSAVRRFGPVRFNRYHRGGHFSWGMSRQRFFGGQGQNFSKL